MKRFLLLSFVLAATLSQAGSVPKEWKYRYKSITKIISSKQLDVFKKLFAPEFTLVNVDGSTAKRAEFYTMVESIFQSKSATASETLKSVTKKGNVYDVSFEMTIKLIDKAGKKSTFREVGTDSWKKIGGKWLMIKTVDTVNESH